MWEGGLSVSLDTYMVWCPDMVRGHSWRIVSPRSRTLFSLPKESKLKQLLTTIPRHFDEIFTTYEILRLVIKTPKKFIKPKLSEFIHIFLFQITLSCKKAYNAHFIPFPARLRLTL